MILGHIKACGSFIYRGIGAIVLKGGNKGGEPKCLPEENQLK